MRDLTVQQQERLDRAIGAYRASAFGGRASVVLEVLRAAYPEDFAPEPPQWPSDEVVRAYYEGRQPGAYHPVPGTTYFAECRKGLRAALLAEPVFREAVRWRAWIAGARGSRAASELIEAVDATGVTVEDLDP